MPPLRPIRFMQCAVAFLLLLGLWSQPSPCQETSGQTSKLSPDRPAASKDASGSKDGSSQDGNSQDDSSSKQNGSAAERITGIQRLLEADRQRQAELEIGLAELEREFHEASAEFSALDDRRAEQKAKAKTAPEKQTVAEQKAAKSSEEERAAARDRFDRIIKRRKAFQQQLEVLKEKIAVAESALERARSSKAPEFEPAETTPKTVPQASSPETQKTEGKAVVALPGIPTEQPADSEQPGDANDGDAEDGVADSGRVVDEQLNEARKGLVTKEAVLRGAQQDLTNRDRAIDVFQRDLESTRQLLEIAREELQAAQATAEARATRLKQAEQAAAPEAEVSNLRELSQESQRELQAAQREVEAQAARLADSEKLLSLMQQGRAEIVERIEQASADVEAAQLHVQFLESPLAPHQLTRWFMRAGPRILSICVAMLVFWWLSRLLARRIVATVIRRSSRGTITEREGRAETLRRVFQSTAGSVIVVLGTLALLDQAGVNITVLLGGAAVLGAAIAFGSQNLIKDYFSGFMILVENQYSVGNVIRVSGTTGVVEDITLRMTVLRDEEGVVHFLPHSQVNTVSNLTHGWSRAVFNIAVGYGEDVDRVMQAIMEVGRNLARDEAFANDVIGELEMLGVDALGESAVTIKFLVKTRPLRQWKVKRELLLRIKRTFDALGIEFPYPQTVVHTRPIHEPDNSANGDHRAAETTSRPR